jgi:hypothetical protein
VRLRPVLRPLLVTAALVAGVATAGTASAAPGFAPASKASVRPGAMTLTDGAQCTANFFFTDPTGAVYVGQAAHCAGAGSATDTDGCTTPSLPLGTPVTIRGATRPGTLVYSSWIAMQAAGERDRNACRYNDFALIRLDPADVGRSNPTVPLFGGPNALDRDGTRFGEPVVSYGNSSLRLGVSALSPKRGSSLGDTGGGWSHTVYTATPGIPGDSGSAVLDGRGNAIGTLSTVAIAPLAGSNGVSDLQHEMAYARVHGMPGLTLVPGTVPFKGVAALR